MSFVEKIWVKIYHFCGKNMGSRMFVILLQEVFVTLK